MNLKALISWFLPARLRQAPFHPDYDEVYTLVLACCCSMVVLPVTYLLLLWFGYQINALLYNALLSLGVVLLMRRGIEQVPVTVMGLLTYVIYYPYIAGSGGIYSPMVGFLYIYLVGAYWGHRHSGAVSAVLNIGVLYLLYRHTPAVTAAGAGSPAAAFMIHAAGMALLGALLWMVQIRQDSIREEVKQLQNHRIEHLDKEVARRTEQLNSMRQSLATDFHDETGNLLSAITRQASMLKLRLPPGDAALPMANSIIRNSNELYASSKHFLWNLNHNSQNPGELFEYLTSFGQSFYNQFDISFSAVNSVTGDAQIDPFASLSLIFIFKEAMNNVIKHANATEVVLGMQPGPGCLELSLTDNGTWKPPVAETGHYGLQNMETRSARHHIGFSLQTAETGTSVRLAVPLLTYPSL